MRVPERFVLGKMLHRSVRSEVCAALCTRTGREVVLKQYRRDSLKSGESRAGHEFKLLSLLTGRGIPRALELLTDLSRAPVLVLERVSGVTLKAWAESGAIPTEAFLEVAIQLAGVLDRIHDVRLLHRDVHPCNVLVDPVTRATTLLDFGLARPLGTAERFGEGGSSSSLSQEIAGVLPYISPEQTGRMSRGMDLRSDLYGLGATLYLALTGHPPFEGNDALTLMHAHLALLPPPPVERRPDAPIALSRIVLKLLEKEPEERYQTAQGLRRDLENCLGQLRRERAIDGEMELGTFDAPLRPLFVRRLYGREREVERLRSAYDRAVRGEAQLVLIAGPPGSGKSALVHELARPAAETGGYIAAGKFDLYRRDVPYSGWAALLRSFVDQVLAERSERVAGWKRELGAALGSIAGALVELAPDLTFLLGDVPPVPELGSREMRSRLALALQRWVIGAATAEHPLVLVLDDLQWADPASLDLLATLLSEMKGAHCLLVGSIRDDGTEHRGAVRDLEERAEAGALRVTPIQLGGLEIDATEQMLADALGCGVGRVRELASQARRKTGSSPLLVQQFVFHLHELGLIRHAAPRGWTWDDAAVSKADSPEGAVAFLVAKLRSLTPFARQVLEFVSCVADEFDVPLLVALSHHDPSELEPVLFSLSQEGLLVPSSGGYRFVHDRVREAAQSMLDDDARERLHAQIAQLLLERLGEREREMRILEIAEHLDRGIRYLPSEERGAAVRINLCAGRRALREGAPAAGRAFLRVARQLWEELGSPDPDPLGFELMLYSIECETLCGDYTGALRFADALERHTLSSLQRAQVAARRIQVLALTQTPQIGTQYALDVLREFGIRWPMVPSWTRVAWELLRTLWSLRGERLQRTMRPAERLDPSFVAPIVVIGAAGTMMSRASPGLRELCACWVVTSNLRRGCVARPAYSLAALALSAVNWLGAWGQAQRLEQASWACLQRSPDPVYGPRAELNIHGMLRPWWRARRPLLAELDRAAQATQELGDLEYYYYCRLVRVLLGALVGERVGEVGRQLGDLCGRIDRSGARYREPHVLARPYRILQRVDLPEEALLQEIAISDREIASATSNSETHARTIWALVLGVLGRWDLAFAQARAVDERRFGGQAHWTNFTLYRAVAAAVLAQRARGWPERRRYRAILRRGLRCMRGWAQRGPDSVHMALWLEAELQWQKGAQRRAAGLYQKAARAAREQEYSHHAALCSERLGELLLADGRRSEGLLALTQAIADYRSWGAAAKAAALEQVIAERSVSRRSPERARARR